MSMLAEPNLESPANVEAAKMFRDDLAQFKKVAHRHVRLTLEPELQEQQEKKRGSTATSSTGSGSSAQGGQPQH